MIRDIILLICISVIYRSDAGEIDNNFSSSQCPQKCNMTSCNTIDGRAQACLNICKASPLFTQIRVYCQGAQQLNSKIAPQRDRPSDISQYSQSKSDAPAKAVISPGDLEKFRRNQGGSYLSSNIENIIISSNTKWEIAKSGLQADSALDILKSAGVINYDEVKNYDVKRGRSGSFTLNLMILTNKVNPEKGLILKQLNWVTDTISDKQINTPQKELLDIEKVKNSAIGNLQGTNFPKIILPTRTFSYVDQHGNKQYISIMPIAKGKSIYDIIEIELDRSGDINPDIPVFKQSFFKAGQSLGSVHLNMATPEIQSKVNHGQFGEFKTIIHGDFHLDNVFFDDKTQVISFIDNASFADAIRDPKYFMTELMYTYAHLLILMMDWQKVPEINTTNKLFNYFVDGYVSNFSPEVRQNMKNFITEQITNLIRDLPDIIQGVKEPAYSIQHMLNNTIKTLDVIKKQEFEESIQRFLLTS